jgi:DNA transformation protein
MKISQKNEFLDYAVELLQPWCAITVRKMFGAHALYCQGKIFAFVIDQQLYFRGRDEAARFFQHADAEQFFYLRKNKAIALPYWSVPVEILEDEERLKQWLDIALYQVPD